MATSAQEIIDTLRDYVEDESIDDVFINYINFALREAVDCYSWGGLYGEKTIAVDATGIIAMPPRVSKLYGIFVSPDAGDIPDAEFKPIRGTRSKDTNVLAQYTYEPYTSTDLSDHEYTCAITQGSSTISQAGSSPFFGSSDVGDALLIDGYGEEYEILSYSEGTPDTIIVSPEVSAETDAAANAFHNPAGCVRFKLRKNDFSLYEGNVLLKYKKTHPRIYSGDSLLHIPCPRFIALRSIQLAMQTNKYNVDSDRINSDVLVAKNQEIGNDPFRSTIEPRKDSMFSVRSKRSGR